MNAESEGNGLPWGRAHQWVIQYQILNAENTPENSIIQNLGSPSFPPTLRPPLRVSCMQAQCHDLKASKEVCMGGFGGKKGKGEMI